MSEFIPLSSFEKENEVSWYKSFASGIASGILKVPEGVFSLAAELIDLGADTDTAADVEQFFDKINIFEEDAEARAIGKLTQTLVQVGVPGGFGAKLANKAARGLTAKAIRAKRGAYFALPKSEKTLSALKQASSLNKKLKTPRYAAIALGGATGEALVADVQDIGTFGDMFQSGPTQLDREERGEGREDAIRKIMNRVKFGSESLLITPAVFGVGKSAKLLAQRGKELAYSNKQFDRFLNKYIRAPFSPGGNLPDEVFDAERIKEGLRSRDINRAKQIVNNITKEVDGMFPATQTMFDKSLRNEKEKFYKSLNSLLFEGDARKAIDPKKMDDLLNKMKQSKVSEESRQILVGSINNARQEFSNLISILDDNLSGVKLTKAQDELSALLKGRLTGWVGSTYRIFEDQGRGLFKVFKRYTPTDEVYEGAVRFFKQQGLTQQTAKQEVDRLLAEVSKIKKPKALDLNNYIKKTVEGRPAGDFIKGVIDDTGVPPTAIRELLGEISDPRYSIFNAMTNLSSVGRTANYLKDIAAKNIEVQQAGKRGFFWATKDAAENAVQSSKTGIEIVDITKDVGFLKKLPGGEKIINPLSETKFTTREINEAIKNINNVAGGLQGFVRGEDQEGAAAAVSWVYRNLLLFPKGISQLAKTVLSVPTHLRNFISAFGFVGANGNLFEPAFYTKAFKEGVEVSGLLKLGDNTPAAQEAYRELLELGVVNSQVQIGDLKNLLRDIKFGEQIANADTILRPFMSKLRKIGEFAQGKYVAEDDTFKIASYLIEKSKLKNGYAKAGMKIPRDSLRFKSSAELSTKFNNAKKVGFKGDYDNFLDDLALKNEAANIVKNTVPNYEFVGSAVRTSRLLPIGNFMSFPSEMIRTTTNIAELGVKQMKHTPNPGEVIRGSNVLPYVFIEGKGLVKNNNPFYADGLKRLTGLATFTTVIPATLAEGAKAMYDVSQEELDALRRFVPDWSKNSTLIPIKDEDGELRYIDFSHSNAYDVIARPLRTLLNNIQDGDMNDQILLSSFVNGVNEAGAEIMNPFIGESIWTEATADLTIRGGRTKDGRLLYTDQTSAGDKAAIRFLHLGEALAPSSTQSQRLAQAAFGVPTKRGDELNIGPELAGFMGFRPIKVDPLKSMGFKIAQYQSGIRNARREFTGGYFGLLRGGPIKPNDVIDRFYKSNKARFDVQQNMYNDISAAQILGVNKGRLGREFKDRQISDKAYRNLQIGRFDPYFPSEDIEARFREIARDLGDADVYRQVRPVLRTMFNDFRRISLGSSWNITVNDYLQEEIQTPPLVTQPMPASNVIQTSAISGTNNNLMASGLTAVENALLSEEEKMIKLRQRGMIT